MSRRFLVTGAILAAGLLLSGCSGGTPISQPGFTASQPLPTSTASTASTVSESDRCAATVSVIGLGNPGEGGTADANVYAAYNALRSKLLMHQENDSKSITDKKVSLTIPTYAGDSEKLRSRVDEIARNYNGEDGYFPKKQIASKAILDAMDTSNKNCPGSHVVFIGYDFGASAIRYALHSLTPEQTSRISGIWLIRDPNRNPSDNDKTTTTFNGESSDLVLGDDTAGGTLKFGGVRGSGWDFDKSQKDRVLIVCFPDDLECNQDMDFVWYTDKFIASHGGNIEALLNPKNPYTDPQVNVVGAEWIASRVWKDVDAAVASKSNGQVSAAADAPLKKYLDYVNGDAAGAQVVQDKAGFPDMITSCDADYAVIGLRGSGQNIDGTMNDKEGDEIVPAPVDGVTYYGGMPSQGGPVIAGFPEFLASSAWQIKTTLPSDKKIRFIPVEYTAVKVQPTREFFDSATQGALMLENKILELEAKCPDTKIVLMGYSQGAQSVHQALHGTDEQHAKNIAAVLFVSDPLRRGDDPVPVSYDPTTYPNQSAPKESSLFSTSGATGNLVSLTELNIDPSTYAIPYFFQGKVMEICDLHDLVCKANLGATIAPHSEVYRHKDHFVFPATWAAQKLMDSK